MKIRIAAIFILIVCSFVFIIGFQNCQKKGQTVEEETSIGGEMGGDAGGIEGGATDDGGPSDNVPNLTCPSNAAKAACAPAGGGTTAGNLNVWGAVDRVFLASEGKSLHQALNTTKPILAGWVFDTDFNGATKKQLGVNIYLNGQFCNSVIANISRSDLKTHWAYPGDPPNYGWGLIIDGLPNGTYMVNAMAVDPNTCKEVALTGNGYSFNVP